MVGNSEGTNWSLHFPLNRYRMIFSIPAPPPPPPISPHYSNSTSKLTSKDSQHPFQIWGSKQTFQLGGKSLGLPQGPELTPSEGTPYESFWG